MNRRQFISSLGLLGAAAAGAGCGRQQGPQARCPVCGVMNDIATDSDGNPLEITCWECGHKWTPASPA